MMKDVTDPVCGMVFSERDAEELGAEKLVHEGKTHWFCCSECKKEFLSEPAAYLE